MPKINVDVLGMEEVRDFSKATIAVSPLAGMIYELARLINRKREIEQQPDAWVHNSTEEEILDGDRRILIRRVIEILPPPQQQAIELAFFRGMSQREIAANTNTPLGTVKTRLELGLKKIYDGLKELRDEL